MSAGLERRMRWAALFFAATAFAPAPADAASRLCRQLETALAQAAGSGGMARSYDRAIAAQTAAIARTRAGLAAASCAPSFFGQGGCDRLRAALREMQANLAALRRTRAGLGGGRAERNSLLASLESNGCRSGGSQNPMPVRARASDAPGDGRPRPRPGGQPFCVRTCDGYFFPMARTTAPVEDQAVCEAACPGTPVEVFYRSNRTEGAMISGRTGLPYAELATANAFRDAGKPRPPGCGCNAAKTYEVMSKPAPLSAPAGDAPDGEAGTGVASPPAAASATGDRKVRVVGPTFLPAPAAAGVPPVPAPTPAP